MNIDSLCINKFQPHNRPLLKIIARTSNNFDHNKSQIKLFVVDKT